MLPQKFLKHYYIIETLLQWNLYSGYSLRASSAFGGNCEKLMHERRVRGDAKAGGGGWERKESLQRSLQNFHFHPAKTPGTTQSVKTVTANMPQIRKSNNCLSSLDSQGRIEIIDLLACFRNSFPLHQRRMFLTTDWFFFIHWRWNFNMPTRITTQ